jgi:hypothetical protein
MRKLLWYYGARIFDIIHKTLTRSDGTDSVNAIFIHFDVISCKYSTADVEFSRSKFWLPVTVSERSKVCTVFAHSKTGSWVRIPLRAWIFSVCVFVYR